MIILKYIALNIILLIPLAVVFALIMTLYHKTNKHWSIRIPGAIIYLIDIILNYELSLLFWDWPDDEGESITERMIRYKAMPVTSKMDLFRVRFAIGLCRFLNKFDPGHC